jgi:hypothetical protein
MISAVFFFLIFFFLVALTAGFFLLLISIHLYPCVSFLIMKRKSDHTEPLGEASLARQQLIFNENYPQITQIIESFCVICG